MNRVRRWVNHNSGARGLNFECPGCKEWHGVQVEPPGWTWNGDLDKPTLSPSVLVRSGHFLPGHQGDCWCTYNAARPEAPSPFSCVQCHSFVRDGRIEFLADCRHALAGQTVELPLVGDEQVGLTS